MIVVADASAAVKLVLDEDGSEQARRIWDEPARWVAPAIVLAEVAAALAAARRAGRLTVDGDVRARRAWLAVSEEIDLLAVDTALSARAGELAAEAALRGMDAVYLATATMLADVEQVGLVSFDRRQRDGIGAAQGVALMPATLPGQPS